MKIKNTIPILFIAIICTSCAPAPKIISTETVTLVPTLAIIPTSVESLEGTIWSGTDSGGKSFVYEFLSNGVLKYTTETGTSTHGSWRQDGSLVYFEMNNKYAESQGVSGESVMTGNGWNQAGYKWTWTANKIPTSQITESNMTPELPPNGISYDGDWKGTTSQNLEVIFTVARNGIIRMKFQAKWDDLLCSRTVGTTIETSTQAMDPTAEAIGNFPPIHPINNATFTVAQDTSNIDGTAYAITGTFLSPQKASGTIEYVVTSGSCQGTKRFDWSATKVSD